MLRQFSVPRGLAACRTSQYRFQQPVAACNPTQRKSLCEYVLHTAKNKYKKICSTKFVDIYTDFCSVENILFLYYSWFLQITNLSSTQHLSISRTLNRISITRTLYTYTWLCLFPWVWSYSLNFQLNCFPEGIVKHFLF